MQLDALPMHGEILRHSLERMAVHNHVDRSIRTEHQQSGRLSPPRQPSQQVQCGMIAPVQILEHKHQRLLGREGFQRLSQLP